MPQMVKRLPARRETRVRFLGQEDPLEKEMAIYSSTLAWKSPWTEEPDRLQSLGLQSRIRLSDVTFTFIYLIWHTGSLLWDHRVFNFTDLFPP